MRRVLVVNGPNLNMLGRRRPEIYGTATLAQLEAKLVEWGSEVGLTVDHLQSNHEGEILDRLHQAAGNAEGVVINPGALTHYSYALHDALEAIDLPVVEVHISNIKAREEWRRTSVVRSACVYTIYGRGLQGYRWALRHLVYRTAWPFETHSYGPEPDQVADLRLPEGPGPHIPVVLYHGGFWLDAWTRDLMDGIAVDLARHGFATWNVEYRRLGSGGGWPATFLDAAAALEPVTSLPGVDRRQVLVLGHSAGGVLALWVAARGDSRRLSRRGESDILPSLAVALAAPTDLPAAVTQKVGYGAIEELLTNAPGDPSQYSPMQMIPLGCPQLVMTGEEDDQVPPGMSIRYAGRAEHAGDEVRLVTIPGAGHFDFLAPESVAWKTVKESLVPVAG